MRKSAFYKSAFLRFFAKKKHYKQKKILCTKNKFVLILGGGQAHGGDQITNDLKWHLGRGSFEVALG